MKGQNESTSSVAPDAPINQEEETYTAMEDDDFEEQFSRLRPHTIKPSRSVGLVIRIELPSEDQIITATPYAPTTIEARPNSSTIQGIAGDTQMAVDVSAGTSSEVDVAPASVVMEAETTTQSTRQTIDEDDEVQIVGETQRPTSPSVMMPDTMAPSTSPTIGPLQNHKFS